MSDPILEFGAATPLKLIEVQDMPAHAWTIESANGVHIAYFPKLTPEAQGLQMECARRMVAAVNACEGIPNDMLVGVSAVDGLPLSLLKSGNILRTERDAAMAKLYTTGHSLAKALDFIEGFEGDELQEGIDDLIGDLRQALASALP